MVHCFLTGVQLDIDKAYVLNRRDARGLLATLNDRIVSLRRLIEQFAPLDDSDEPEQGWRGGERQQRRHAAARKHHRLVCKAVADAMAPGFPEIKLFQTWPSHRAHVQAVLQHGLLSHPVHGAAIKSLDEKSVNDGERLGRAVLRLLDPQQQLPQRTRLAVCAAACLNLCGKEPEEAASLIRASVASASNSPSLALSKRDRRALKSVGAAHLATLSPAPAMSGTGETS
jgi:hypothetical protein